jgi:hypothetical protein
LRWWQPFVVLLDLYLLASVTPWLFVAALNWSLRYSYRSLATVIGYLDKLQQALVEQSAWWPAQPRFGPYTPPVQQAEALLPRLSEQLGAAQSLALPLRGVRLAECSISRVLTCRCWATLVAVYALWRTVHRLANLLADVVPNIGNLQAAQRIVEAIPRDPCPSKGRTQSRYYRLRTASGQEYVAGG